MPSTCDNGVCDAFHPWYGFWPARQRVDVTWTDQIGRLACIRKVAGRFLKDTVEDQIGHYAEVANSFVRAGCHGFPSKTDELARVTVVSRFQSIAGIQVEKEMTMIDSSKLLLSRREVAEVLGVSVDTVANLLTTGELKSVRIGKSVLVPKWDVEALIARGTAKTRRSD